MQMKIMSLLFGLVIFSTSCTKKSVEQIQTKDPEEETPLIDRPVYNGMDTLGDWTVVYQAASGARLTNIQFSSAKVGYIVDIGSDGQGRFQNTTNNGITWSTEKNLPTEANEFRVTSKNIGFAFRSSMPPFETVGQVPLYQTVNSGESWYNIFRSNLRYTTIMNVVFPSDQAGFGITEVGECIALNSVNSRDFAVKTISTLPVTGSFNLAFPTLNIGWVIAATRFNSSFLYQGVTIFKTSDAGVTWNKQFEDPTADLRSFPSICFSNATNGWASTGTDVIYRTINGGVTWQKSTIVKLNQSKIATNKIVFANSARGFVATTNEIFETADGGISWTRSCKTGSNYIEDIFYQKETGTVWAVSGNRVLKL